MKKMNDLLIFVVSALALTANGNNLEEKMSRYFSRINIGASNSLELSFIKWSLQCRVRDVDSKESYLTLNSGDTMLLTYGDAKVFTHGEGGSLVLSFTNKIGKEEAEYGCYVEDWEGDGLLLVKYSFGHCVVAGGDPVVREYYVVNIAKGKCWDNQKKTMSDFKLPFRALWKDWDEYKEKSKYDGASCRRPSREGERPLAFFRRLGRRVLAGEGGQGRELWIVGYCLDKNDALPIGTNRFARGKIAKLKKSADGYLVCALAELGTNGFGKVFIYDDSSKVKCRIDRFARNVGVEFLYNEYDELGGFVRSKRIDEDHPLDKSCIDDTQAIRLARDAFETANDLFDRFMAGDFDIPPPEICPRPERVSPEELERLRKGRAHDDEASGCFAGRDSFLQENPR